MTKKNEAAPASVKANGAASTSPDTYDTTNANMYSCEKQISHENDEHGATLDAQAPVVPANQQAKASAAPAKVLRLDRHEVDRSAPVRGRIAQMTVDLGRKPTPAELVDRVNTPLSILIIERATGLLFAPKIKPFDAGTPESDQAREEWESWHAAYIANRMPTKLAYPAVAEEITRVPDEYTDGSDPGVHKLSNVLDWCFDFTEVESEWVQATDKKGNPLVNRDGSPQLTVESSARVWGLKQLLREQFNIRESIDGAAWDDARMALEAWRHVGRDDLAIFDAVPVRYVPDCNESVDGPYERLTDKELIAMAQEWDPTLDDEGALGMVEHLKRHVADFDKQELELREAEDVKVREARAYRDTYLVPVRNGMYDRKTGILRPYTREDHFIGKFAGITLPTDDTGHVIMPPEPEFADENAPNGVWKPSEWFDEVMPDPEGRDAILMEIIACLFPRIEWRKAFLNFGLGRNGKGCINQCIETMVGPHADELVTHFSMDQFDDEKNIAEMPGKMGNYSDESNPDGFLSDASTLKAAITHDWARGRAVYKQPVQFRPKMTLLFNLNQEMNSSDKSDALFERFHTVLFLSTYFGRENPRIKAEYMLDPRVASRFAAKALLQYPELVKFEENDYVRRGTELYRDGVDPVRQFMRTEILPELDVDPDTGAPILAVPFDFLYDAYKPWFKANVPSGKPVGKRAFCSSVVAIAEREGWVAPREVGTVNAYAKRKLARWYVQGAFDGIIERLCKPSNRTVSRYEPADLYAWKTNPQNKADSKGDLRGWLGWGPTRTAIRSARTSASSRPLWTPLHVT